MYPCILSIFYISFLYCVTVLLYMPLQIAPRDKLSELTLVLQTVRCLFIAFKDTQCKVDIIEQHQELSSFNFEFIFVHLFFVMQKLDPWQISKVQDVCLLLQIAYLIIKQQEMHFE